MKEEKKIVHRATKDCIYSDGQHQKKIFKVGERLPDDWETGHNGFKHFAPEDGLTSGQRKMEAEAAKYAKT